MAKDAEKGDGRDGRSGDLDALSRWPLRDLVVSYKGCLKRRGEAQKRAQAEGRARTEGSPTRTLPEAVTKTFTTRPTANMYPYTKGPDFGNEGLGYGDLVRVKLLIGQSQKLQSVPHLARRTRSGITPLVENGARFIDEDKSKTKP